MLNPIEAATWWTAFGAIAQAIGALATFMAVAASLWIVVSERKMKVRGSAGIRMIFAGDGTPGVYLVGIEVLNVGLRPFHIISVGWRTGWLQHGPKELRYRFAVQNTSHTLNRTPAPHIVEPGRSEAFYVYVSDMKLKAHEEARFDLFKRRVPLLGAAPIWAIISITGRKPHFVRVEKDLALFLRTGEHATNTDEAGLTNTS